MPIYILLQQTVKVSPIIYENDGLSDDDNKTLSPKIEAPKQLKLQMKQIHIEPLVIAPVERRLSETIKIHKPEPKQQVPVKKDEPLEVQTKPSDQTPAASKSAPIHLPLSESSLSSPALIREVGKKLEQISSSTPPKSPTGAIKKEPVHRQTSAPDKMQSTPSKKKTAPSPPIKPHKLDTSDDDDFVEALPTTPPSSPSTKAMPMRSILKKSASPEPRSAMPKLKMPDSPATATSADAGPVPAPRHHHKAVPKTPTVIEATPPTSPPIKLPQSPATNAKPAPPTAAVPLDLSVNSETPDTPPAGEKDASLRKKKLAQSAQSSKSPNAAKKTGPVAATAPLPPPRKKEVKKSTAKK